MLSFIMIRIFTVYCMKSIYIKLVNYLFIGSHPASSVSAIYSGQEKKINNIETREGMGQPGPQLLTVTWK